MSKITEQLTGVVTFEKVVEMESLMKKMPQVEVPVRNYFSAGVYAREIRIPAGATVTGKIHKLANLNILSEGEMIVSTDDGMKRVKAPFTVVSPPGTKRIAHAITDCVWTTVHGTHVTDVDAIEVAFTADSEQDYLQFCQTQQIQGA